MSSCLFREVPLRGPHNHDRPRALLHRLFLEPSAEWRPRGPAGALVPSPPGEAPLGHASPGPGARPSRPPRPAPHSPTWPQPALRSRARSFDSRSGCVSWAGIKDAKIPGVWRAAQAVLGTPGIPLLLRRLMSTSAPLSQKAATLTVTPKTGLADELLDVQVEA